MPASLLLLRPIEITKKGPALFGPAPAVICLSLPSNGIDATLASLMRRKANIVRVGTPHCARRICVEPGKACDARCVSPARGTAPAESGAAEHRVTQIWSGLVSAKKPSPYQPGHNRARPILSA
jgi:hypothetical protein